MNSLETILQKLKPKRLSVLVTFWRMLQFSSLHHLLSKSKPNFLSTNQMPIGSFFFPPQVFGMTNFYGRSYWQPMFCRVFLFFSSQGVFLRSDCICTSVFQSREKLLPRTSQTGPARSAPANHSWNGLYKSRTSHSFCGCCRGRGCIAIFVTPTLAFLAFSVESFCHSKFVKNQGLNK